MSECKCNLRTRLVGDGCEKCNPQMAIDLLKEQVREQADEIERLRITDEEREVLTNTREWMLYGNRHGVDKAPPIIDALLKRHAKGGAA